MMFSDYNNPVGLIAATVIIQLLSAICVGPRFYSRRLKRQPFITSDWLVLAAFIFGVGLTAIEIQGEFHVPPGL